MVYEKIVHTRTMTLSLARLEPLYKWEKQIACPGGKKNCCGCFVFPMLLNFFCYNDICKWNITLDNLNVINLAVDFWLMVYSYNCIYMDWLVMPLQFLFLEADQVYKTIFSILKYSLLPSEKTHAKKFPPYTDCLFYLWYHWDIGNDET